MLRLKILWLRLKCLYHGAASAWYRFWADASNYKVQVLKERIRVEQKLKQEAERLDRLRHPERYRGH